MARKGTSSWYGVRTLIRLTASGRPKVQHEHFDPDSTLVEDRVVLFRATSFEDAIRQGEKEARNYCETSSFENIYGQRVRLKFLGAVDAFSIPDDAPSHGCEVYSSTALVPKSVSNVKLTNERFGRRAYKSARRYKFLDAEILSGALHTKRANPASPAHTIASSLPRSL